MSRILYLDTFSGISGDMFLGALVDAGLPLEALVEGLRSLPLEGYRLSAETVYRGPFRATRLRVHLEGTGGVEPADSHSHSHSQAQESDSHSHAHTHTHSHSHSDGHSHSHEHSGIAEGNRNLADIRGLLEKSELGDGVRSRALEVFERLGKAEARAHGVPLEEVHFHEVGAVDSIVDIVGACLALDLLKIDSVWSTPMTLGSGFARGAHGTFPLPAPATVEVLRGVPVRQRDSTFELTTPTGAALASTLSSGFGPMPPMTISAVGYGAGNDHPGEIPNLLRVLLGEDRLDPEKDRVVVLETNVDDMSPQWIGHLIDQLLEAGALDVTVTPILMKKSRPAHQISVIARPGKETALEDLLFRESTTFGIRKQEIDRAILQRRWETVETPWGEVSIKVGRRGDRDVIATPEYEDLKRVAARGGVSVKEAHTEVMSQWRRRGGGSGDGGGKRWR